MRVTVYNEDGEIVGTEDVYPDDPTDMEDRYADWLERNPYDDYDPGEDDPDNVPRSDDE